MAMIEDIDEKPFPWRAVNLQKSAASANWRRRFDWSLTLRQNLPMHPIRKLKPLAARRSRIQLISGEKSRMPQAAAVAQSLEVSDTLGAWRLARKVAETRWFVVYLGAPSSCDPDWPADYAVKFIQPALAGDRKIRQLLQREIQ